MRQAPVPPPPPFPSASLGLPDAGGMPTLPDIPPHMFPPAPPPPPLVARQLLAPPTLPDIPVPPFPPLPLKTQYIPPRLEFDSEPQLTRIIPPDPSLLAMTRGERGPPGWRALVWFLLGMISGAGLVWSQTRDVRADVARAREWAGAELRELTADSSTPPVILSAPAPAPAVAPPPSSEIPTVDVNKLPRSGAAPAPPSTGAFPSAIAPPPASTSSPSPAPSPSPMNGPALPHAPGPR